MIKIIKGVYGYLDEHGTVKPKTEQDGPFELSPEKEARLVGLGVAVYVDGGSTALPDGVEMVPDYNAGMKADELRAIAKKYMGLTFKVGTSKAEMVEAMDKHIEDHTVEGDDFNDTPEEMENGEAPPSFDPAEAVE